MNTVQKQLTSIQMMVQAGFSLDDFLVLVECGECGHEHYFEPSSLDEHWPCCEECGAKLADNAPLPFTAEARHCDEPS